MTAMQKTLPKGWKWVKIGEVIQSISLTGKKLKQIEYQEKGKLPVIDQGQSLIGGYTDKEEFSISESPVIIFGDHTKIIKYIDFDFVAGADGIRVIKPFKFYHPRLFYYLLNSISLPDKGYARHFQLLREQTIPLPPLQVQHKIVEILEEADNLRKLRRMADENMKDLIPSLFVQMFGDPATNPKGWEVKHIDSIKSPEKFSIVDGPFGSAMKVSDYIEDGIPVIQVSNITPDGFKADSLRYISEEKYQSIKRSTVQSGEILIAKVGHTIGKACIMPPLFEKAVITANCAKIKINESLASTIYINHFINTPSFQKQIRKELGNTAKPMMNLTSIKNFQIFLPPLPLQQEFAKMVEDIEAEKARQTESRKKLDELFQSLMQRAFTGELVA